MKRLAIPIICLLMLTTQVALAQQGIDQTPRFDRLDGKRVPHQLLLDKAEELYETRLYDGTLRADNFVSLNIFTALLRTVETASMSGAISKPTGGTSATNQQGENRIPILALLYKMSCIRSDALDRQLIHFEGNAVRDRYVGGQWQNPYQELNVCAVSASRSIVYTSDVELILDEGKLFTNQSISKIELDADDGRGFRALRRGEVLPIKYPSAGEKTLKLRLTLANGSSYLSHTKIKIEQKSEEELRGSSSARAVPPPQDWVVFTTKNAYKGQRVTASVKLECSLPKDIPSIKTL